MCNYGYMRNVFYDIHYTNYLCSDVHNGRRWKV